MSGSFIVRVATASDIELISWQRARMFTDMDKLPVELFESFRVQSLDVLDRMFKANEYIGWLASPQSRADQIIAGAGVQLRQVPPHPRSDRNGKITIVAGRQAVIGNVYTEPEWRRRGVTALLIKTIIEWTRGQAIDSLVLYAAAERRIVYEKLGFVAGSEMQFNL